ncbi:MAG: hypothetical protein AB7F28_04900 [Candidatus Margulisiibacteriota bacterium]
MFKLVAVEFKNREIDCIVDLCKTFPKSIATIRDKLLSLTPTDIEQLLLEPIQNRGHLLCLMAETCSFNNSPGTGVSLVHALLVGKGKIIKPKVISSLVLNLSSIINQVQDVSVLERLVQYCSQDKSNRRPKHEVIEKLVSSFIKACCANQNHDALILLAESKLFCSSLRDLPEAIKVLEGAIGASLDAGCYEQANRAIQALCQYYSNGMSLGSNGLKIYQLRCRILDALQSKGESCTESEVQLARKIIARLILEPSDAKKYHEFIEVIATKVQALDSVVLAA